jgi:hypothetical protein
MTFGLTLIACVHSGAAGIPACASAPAASNPAPSTQPAEEKPDVAMKKMAQTTVDSIRTIYHVELNYSTESLSNLEKVLSDMHDEHVHTPIREQGLRIRSFAIGAYVGEVMRRRIGGHWQEDKSATGDNLSLVLPSGTEAFPLSWVYKRIVNGSDDNIEHKVAVVLELEKQRK